MIASIVVSYTVQEVTNELILMSREEGQQKPAYIVKDGKLESTTVLVTLTPKRVADRLIEQAKYALPKSTEVKSSSIKFFDHGGADVSFLT
jgi:hypothetical protein